MISNSTVTNDNKTAKPGIQTVKASQVIRKQVEWLYPGRIPRGGITNITGDPGIGKGYFTAHVIAKLTSGAMLPDMTEAIPPINALILAEEDDAETVLRPRLEDMGADLDRVHIYTGYIDKTGQSSQFNIALIDELRVKIVEEKIDLVVIDPLIDFFGLNDINKAEQVKQLLLPLHRLAKSLKIAIVAIIHCNKNDVKALYKGTGSIQFAGKARSVFFVERSPEDENDKVISHIKMNVVKPSPSLTYCIQENSPGKPILVFKAADEGKWTADDLLGSSRPKPEKDDAAKELLDFILRRTPVPTKEFEALGQRLGISERTINRARSALQIRSEREKSPNGTDYWMLYHPEWHPGTLAQDSPSDLSAKLDKVLNFMQKIESMHGTLGHGTLNDPNRKSATTQETRTGQELTMEDLYNEPIDHEALRQAEEDMRKK